MSIDNNRSFSSHFWAERSTIGGKLRNELISLENYADNKKTKQRNAGELKFRHNAAWLATKATGRGIGCVSMPVARTVDACLNSGLGLFKLGIGMLIGTINLVDRKIRHTPSPLIKNEHWTVGEAKEHGKNAGFCLIDIFASPLVVLINPKRLYPKQAYQSQKQAALKRSYKMFMDKTAGLPLPTAITKNELKKIHRELKKQANERILNGEKEFTIKINPKKDDSLPQQGIHHSAIVIVKDGHFDPTGVIIHTGYVRGQGASRKAEDARYLNGDLVIHHKLIKKAKNGVIDTATVNELKILKKLDHPNIMKIKHIRNKEPAAAKGKQVRPGIYYEALPYKLGRADDKLGNPHRQMANQLLGIARGLSHCHERNIFHRDVKPANAGLTEEGVAKLMDFGESIEYKEEEDRGYVFKGTAAYTPPELLAGGDFDLTTSQMYAQQDAWGFACLVFQLFSDDPKKEKLPRAIQEKADAPVPLYACASIKFDKNDKEITAFAEEHGEVGQLVLETFFGDFGKRPSIADFVAALERHTRTL